MRSHLFSAAAPACAAALATLLALAPAACTDAPDAGEGEGEGDAAEGEGDAAEGEGDALHEQEPNDGAAVTDTNDLPIGETMQGSIANANDIDIFAVPTVGGTRYHVALVANDGSPLDGHLTVLDNGRGGDAAGEDYVRLVRAPDGPNATLDFLAFGSGHLIAVRDARDVDGTRASGDDSPYSLVVSEVPLAAASIAFPASVDDALASEGDVKLYTFDAVQDADFTVALTAHGNMDARLFVLSVASGDWVVRNDDGDGVNPLLDAFFPEGGPMILVVEATVEGAFDLTYTLTTTGN